MKYIKKEPIEAVQLTDETSGKLTAKYEITSAAGGMWHVDDETGYAHFKMFEGSPIHMGDWIATVSDGEHWVITDDVFKRMYKAVSKPTRRLAEFYPNSLKSLLSDNVLPVYGDGYKSAADIARTLVDNAHAYQRDMTFSIEDPYYALGLFQEPNVELFYGWLLLAPVNQDILQDAIQQAFEN